MHDQPSGTPETAAPIQPVPSGPQTPYTGVVIIHGLGIIARNTTLEEASNALTYWFNHQAGLALRRDGPGRVWLSAHLTDDPNPDAPAAQARMEIAAPSAPSAPSTPTDQVAVPLRLEFREVWWAESFGLPSVAGATRWTRVQLREQAANIFALFRTRRGSTGPGTYAPPRQTTSLSTPRRETDASLNGTAQGSHVAIAPAERAALRSLLWLYGMLQYVWKAIQWLILIPLVFILLLLMGVLRLLAVIPALRSTVIASISALLSLIMLHWIAEAQVYTTDYTRSAAVRERFDREINAFLADPNCERIVVIGHSMGTVIAYEGLTTTLPQDGTPLPKPVTFICLAQALRRIWLMTADDPHRLRGVLPADVRWLHFWARYDPVAAGPLTRLSLPHLRAWPDLGVPDPSAALSERLKTCANIAVVNTDATFSDHTTYWNNLEQVVGPIARELVAGHADLEQLVEARLATPDDKLLRRWRVAWRASVSLLAGVAAAAGMLIWAAQNPAVGSGITAFLEQVNWAALFGSVCPACQAIPLPALPPNATTRQIQDFAAQSARLAGGALTYLFTHYLTGEALVVGAVALLAGAVAMWLVGRLVAQPAPFRFRDVIAADGAGGPGFLFAIPAVAVVLVFVASFIFSGYVHRAISFGSVPQGQFITAYVVTLGIDELIYAVAYLVIVVATIQARQWGWLASVVLAVALVFPFDPFYRGALLAVAVVGLLVRAASLWRARGCLPWCCWSSRSWPSMPGWAPPCSSWASCMWRC